ncbi:neuroblastoma breakpoint family member 4-like [Rhinopithecus roxellana]|uniref:neuroblastoma breakpoint family member 4-like n=1 Tax=Rhinopithecus roxellana TaxID=61622 RepID=UPI001237696A|nr:neuroblastoma breakpoint family member 4-like [Rhinopithecus roxellana]
MCLGFFSPVPGSTSSATNVSMVVSADPLSGKRAEMNILEINQELRSQLAESNQQFRDLKEKFLITQATAYSLANQLKKYKKRNDLEEVKGQETIDPRLSREPLTVAKHEVPQESLDGCCLTPSILPELPHSYRPYGSTSYYFEEKQVTLALVDKIQKDQEEVEDQDPPCPRLSQELPEVEEQEIPEDSVDEVYLTPSVHHDLSDCHQPYSNTLYSLEDQFACSALDIASPTKTACPQGTWSGDLSHHLSEVQSSQAQLEPSTLVPKCLQLQLDQGNGLARQGLSSTTCSFSANADSGKQWPFQELVLQPSLGMKNPPQLGGDALEGSADNTQGHQVIGQIHAFSVLEPKIIKRKLPLSKWRLACRFPGLQASGAEILNTAGSMQRMKGYHKK